jgi:hypothetical protein
MDDFVRIVVCGKIEGGEVKFEVTEGECAERS